MLLARTDPSVPKHQGITCFAFDMHQEGVDVRPLREMTGHAMFSEVFISDARIDHRRDHRRTEQRLGGCEHHARVRARRSRRRRRRWCRWYGVTRDGRRPPGQARRRLRHAASQRRRTPWRCAADARRRRDVVRCPREGQRHVVATRSIRQKLAHLYILGEIGRLNTERAKALRSAGRHPRHRRTSRSC